MTILVVEFVERAPAEELAARRRFESEHLRETLLEIFGDLSLDFSSHKVSFGRFTDEQIAAKRADLEPGEPLATTWAIVELPRLLEDNLTMRMNADNSFAYVDSCVEI